MTIFSLASLLEKGNLTPLKLDEIKKKANILARFAEEKMEEGRESVERAKEEL